jgi:hypothetical protein
MYICTFLLSKKEALRVEISFLNHSLRQVRQLRQHTAIEIFLDNAKVLCCGMMCSRCTIIISPGVFFQLKKEDLYIEK